MSKPRIVQIKRAILTAETMTELTAAVEDAITLCNWRRGYNYQQDYSANAIIADANLNSGMADCLRQAAQREKVLRQRLKLGTTELQRELEL